MANPEITPVLIQQSDLEGLSDDANYRHHFYVDELEPLLEAKRSLGKDAILDAAVILMTQSAAVIVHIDQGKQRKSYALDDDRMVYESNTNSIGFNDHGGGSESGFKILLNGSPDEADMSYVLYSPPDERGNPTNTTFRRADFTFLGWEANGPYGGPGYVPNPLKTAGASMAKGRGSSYEYYLFGNSDTPTLVYERFAAAGFSFSRKPYLDGLGVLDEPGCVLDLGRYEGPARRALGYKGWHLWPGDQFAEQLKQLGVEMPKISIEDYPLVKPENQL